VCNHGHSYVKEKNFESAIIWFGLRSCWKISTPVASAFRGAWNDLTFEKKGWLAR
jgi:hypothetical protein